MKTEMILCMMIAASGGAHSSHAPHGHAHRHPRKALQALGPTEGQLTSVLRIDNKKCPVDGRDIDSTAVLVVWKNLLVSLSSQDCKREFAKDPDGYTRNALRIVGRDMP